MAFKTITLVTSTLLLSTSVNAALLERLNGQAFYDDEANLTWLADANYTQTNPSDIHEVYGPTDWAQANDWVADLNIAGVTGWRLPTTLQPDDSCSRQSAMYGSYGYNCTGSELGNMFYNVLGGTAYSDIAVSHNANYDLFSNIVSGFYWSETDFETDEGTSAWTFRFDRGEQRTFNKSIVDFYAWAVHDGDVSAVPVPAAVWLFGSGLIGLVGFARHKA